MGDPMRFSQLCERECYMTEFVKRKLLFDHRYAGIFWSNREAVDCALSMKNHEGMMTRQKDPATGMTVLKAIFNRLG